MAYLTHRPYSADGSANLWRGVLGWNPARAAAAAVQQPHGLEISRTETGYTVEVPVPGYKPENVDVTVDQNVLTVAGKTEKREFSRSLLLPDEIDADGIVAHVEDGLLTLTLGYVPKASPRKINVSFGTKDVSAQ